MFKALKRGAQEAGKTISRKWCRWQHIGFWQLENHGRRVCSKCGTEWRRGFGRRPIDRTKLPR